MQKNCCCKSLIIALKLLTHRHSYYDVFLSIFHCEFNIHNVTVQLLMIVALDNHRKVIESFNLTPFGCIVGESVAGIRQHFSRVISRFICFGDDGVLK